MRLTYRQRVLLLGALAGLGGAVLVARVFVLAVVQAGEWRAKAEGQVAEWTVVHARRGRILDRNGRELAADEAGYELTVRAAAWRSLMHECPRCGLVRFYRPGQKPGTCSRCKSGSFGPVDRRDVTRVAALLGIPAPQLIETIERNVSRVERAVERGLDSFPERQREQERAQRWADLGWRPRRVARDVPYEVAREVDLHPHRNPAFKIVTVHARRSLGGRDFAHIVGQVRPRRVPLEIPGESDREAEIPTGVAGIEGAFDPILRGEPGWLQVVRDPREGEGRVVARRAPSHGLDVRLTIDAEDQARAMAALAGAGGALVVVDASTGDVLAAASSPGYEPDEYARVLEAIRAEAELSGRWPRHHALQESSFRDFHAPGSIVKPFTALAAIDAGLAAPSTRITCEHYFTNRRGERITSLRCNGEHGEVDLHAALVRSCNIYFQTLQREMIEHGAIGAFHGTGRSFGFGLPTGIELEPRPFRDGYRLAQTAWGERILAAIGQGPVALSPAQVARAYAGLATGSLPRLRVVAEAGGRPTPVERTPLGLPAEALAAVRAALLEVPRTGTAAGYGLERWPVAVKTGTAQIGVDVTAGLHNAWVAGFAAAHAGRPAIAFALVVFDTELGGAEASAPRLAEFLRGFYGRAAE